MDRSTPIFLIAVESVKDAIGQYRKIETERLAYARIRSVTGNEFYEAGRSGIDAQYQITMFRYDYNGEAIVLLNGKRYAVYRTYERTDDSIELYVQSEVGVTNGI